MTMNILIHGMVVIIMKHTNQDKESKNQNVEVSDRRKQNSFHKKRGAVAPQYNI